MERTDRLGEPTLPTQRIERAHSPERADYRDYRPCLRWDFAFHCAFCFLHENDLAPFDTGAGGTGLFWVEHRVPQSHDDAQAARYTNCLWSCRFCNRARGTAPLVRDGRVLLEPTTSAWAQRFALADGQMRPLDDDAVRTHEVYDLDDPRKVERRRARSRRARDVTVALAELPALVDRLLGRAEDGDPTALAAARQIERTLVRARADALRMRRVPTDSPRRCACNANLRLPAWATG